MAEPTESPADAPPVPLHVALEDTGIDSQVFKIGGCMLTLYEPHLETVERVSALLEPYGVVLSIDGMQSVQLPGEAAPKNIAERLMGVNLGKAGPAFVVILFDHPDNRAGIEKKHGVKLDTDEDFARWLKPRCGISVVEDVIATLPKFAFFKRLGKRMGSLGPLIAQALAAMNRTAAPGGSDSAAS